jgi:YD repeat-containing protein
MLNIFRCAALLTIALPAFGQITSAVIFDYYPAGHISHGLLKSETNNGIKTSYTYYSNGSLWSVTNSRGVTTQFENYKRGIAQKEVHAVGTASQITIVRVIDDNGCLSSETNGEGGTTLYGRDALCRITSKSLPRANSINTAVRYVPATGAFPETHTLTRGNYIEISKYDGFGRLIERAAGGIKQIWRYDALGRKRFVSYPVFETDVYPVGDTFTYDVFDRLLTVTHADGTFAAYTYGKNADGRPQIIMTNERGHQVTNVFRAFGGPDTAELMLILTAEPAISSPNVEMKRNVLGQITSVTQAGLTRTYSYDSRFYLTSTVNPEIGTTKMGRDNAGNLTSLQNNFGGASTGVTYFDIDPLGQVTNIRYPDSSMNVTQDWSKNGKLISARTVVNARNWSYDANGNLQQESLDIGGQQSFVISYSYDFNDRLTQIAYPKKGSILNLNPDVLARPKTVGDFVTNVNYMPNGIILGLTYKNSITTSITLDVRQRPKIISAGNAINVSMSYDGAGNVISVADTLNASNDRGFGYDAVDRLNQVTVGGKNFPLTYDGSGNIRTQNFGGLLTYQYNTAGTNRLISTTGIKTGSYLYDTRGNITSNGLVAFQYDDNSRLQCAKCGQADEIRYAYDALGMRVSRAKGGQTNYLMYSSSGDLLVELNPSTNQRQEHIYLQGQKIATLTDSAYFATSLGLKISSSNVTPGQAVTLTATLNGGRTPEGTVNFYDNGVWIGSGAVSAGKVTLTTAALNFGYHDFTAAYAGDGSSAASNTSVYSRVESGQVTSALMSVIQSYLLDD